MPTSTDLERDARQVSARHDKVAPGEIAIGVVIGRTSEYFDFFVYAIASVLIFPALLFPFADRLTGTLWSFAIFGLAFLARPVGSVVFMWVDRLYGRGTKLTAALFLLGGSTAAMAFLPSYADAGLWAAALLALFRAGQGTALAGTWDGMSTLLALNAPPERRGWYAMIPQLGAPIGLLVAAALFAFLAAELPPADFAAWGWRYPFFVAFAINVVALFARLRLVVTHEFGLLFERGELAPMPVIETIVHERKVILLGAFAPLASFALFHIVTVFPLSWVMLNGHTSPAHFLVIEAAAAAIALVAMIASGPLADRFGRRTLLGTTAIGTALFGVLPWLLIDGGEKSQALLMGAGAVLLGLSFGQASGAINASFDPRYRYTGAAFTSDLAWLFGAGFAPFVALALASRFGLWTTGAYLLSGAIATVLALYFNKELGKKHE